MSIVQDVLQAKSDDVHTIDESASALTAIEKMNEHSIGALVVVHEGRVTGMFTERDVLRRIVAQGADPAVLRVRDVMTRKVICINPETTLNDARAVMKDRHIRHLPVVDNHGELAGMISIGDLNAWCIADGEVKIQFLEEYLYGRA